MLNRVRIRGEVHATKCGYGHGLHFGPAGVLSMDKRPRYGRKGRHGTPGGRGGQVEQVGHHASCTGSGNHGAKGGSRVVWTFQRFTYGPRYGLHHCGSGLGMGRFWASWVFFALVFWLSSYCETSNIFKAQSLGDHEHSVDHCIVTARTHPMG